MKRVAVRLSSGLSKWSLVAAHEFVGLAILCALLFSGAALHAQSAGSSAFETMNELAPASPRGQVQDLVLDHAVKSGLGNTAAALAEWRQNHFTTYLSGVSALAGFGLGIMAALLGHYWADPRAKWLEVRRKTTLLAAVGGLGASVLLVGVMLSVPPHGRLTFLVFSAVICTLTAAVVCSVSFLIVRRIRERRAAMAGRFFDPDRISGA